MNSYLFSLHIYCRDHVELSYGRNPLPALTIAMLRRHCTQPQLMNTNGGKTKSHTNVLNFLYSTDILSITQTPKHPT